MIRLLSIFLLLISLTGFSQNYIGKTKEQVRKELNKYIVKNDTTNAAIDETDTAIILRIKEKPTQPAEFIYKFDKAGKCNYEKTIAYCDSCYTKFLNTALSNKKYGWKRINGNQYVSNYNAQMMIELPVNDKDLSFIILRTGWTKELYKMLKGQ